MPPKLLDFRFIILGCGTELEIGKIYVRQLHPEYRPEYMEGEIEIAAKILKVSTEAEWRAQTDLTGPVPFQYYYYCEILD